MATVYIGNLDVEANVKDLHRDFDRYGKISDVWIARKPPGFAFVEFDHERDAKDAVKDMDGRRILGKNIRVEISRRRGARGDRGDHDGGESSRRDDDRRNKPRREPPQRSDYRIRISGIPENVDWRGVKDRLRELVAEPVYVAAINNGEGVCDFKTEEDADSAVTKLNDTEFEGGVITVVRAEVQEETSAAAAGQRRSDGGRDRRDTTRDRGRDTRDRDRGRGGDRDNGRRGSRRDRSRSRSDDSHNRSRSRSRHDNNSRKRSGRDRERERDRSRSRDREVSRRDRDRSRD